MESAILNGLNKVARNAFGRLQKFSIPAGIWILIAVVLLVGGRLLRIAASPPAHTREIATEYGNIASLLALPQVNSDGTAFAFGQTTETGAGIYFYDQATGQKQLLYDEKEAVYRARNFAAWPWSPDGRMFLSTHSITRDDPIHQRMILWNPAAGETLLDRINNHRIIALTWLTSDAFVWVDPDFGFHCISRADDHHWSETGLIKVTAARPESGLCTLSSNTVAWLQKGTIWILNLETQNAAPPFTPKKMAVTSFDYCQETGNFLLSCYGNQGSSLWRLTPGPVSDVNPGPLEAPAGAEAGRWINHGQGFAYLNPVNNNKILVVQADNQARPLAFFEGGNVSRFTASADGGHLIVYGVASNELSQGAWDYNVRSNTLRCLIPCSEQPVQFARRMEPVKKQLVLPSGRRIYYYLHYPANFNPHKKYPLVMGNVVHDYVYADATPSYACALANCGAYVAIAERAGWFDKTSVEEWPGDVMGLYHYLAQDPTIDTRRVFLFGRSAETYYVVNLLKEHAEPWRGVMPLNGGFPSLQEMATGKHVPKVLISTDGHSSGSIESLIKYQEAARKLGVEVELSIQPDAPHDYVAIASFRERCRAMVKFVFDD